MNEFDDQLRSALRDDDAALVPAPNKESGYYREVFSSLKGPDAAMNRLTWVGIFVASGLLIFFLISAFQAENVREQVLYAALAVMLNSAQIALKLWFNMRLNRRVVLHEIKQLRLQITQQH